MVRPRPAGRGVARVHAQAASQPVGAARAVLVAQAPCGEISRAKEHDAKRDGDGGVGQARGERGAGQSPEGRGHLEEHADADVGETLADERRGGAGGGGDDGDERCADGVADVDAERQREHRDDDHAAAEAGQRAEQAGDDGAGRDEGDEDDERHGSTAITGSGLASEQNAQNARSDPKRSAYLDFDRVLIPSSE